MNAENNILEINDLEKYFYENQTIIKSLFNRKGKPIKAVDDVSLSVGENEVIGVIGESGCGKTTLLRVIAGIYEPTGGELRYRGQAVNTLDKNEWKNLRENIQIIFQNPFTSLNPKMTVEESIREPLEIFDIDDKEDRIYETLGQVELNPPDQYLDRVPDQLSGGELQRVSIARALISEPELILADEPVSMLDVSTQSKLLNLLSRITSETDTSMLYISHDLSTVATVCDEVNVMYLGRIVERGATSQIINEPQHPYTRELIKAIPIPDPGFERERTQISGDVPDPSDEITGCRFKDRCPDRMDICEKKPKFVQADNGSKVACHLHYDHETEGNPAREQ